jgi:2-acylglycerol O-acyltransferase 2
MPFFGPTLANVIAIQAWIAPIFLLPGSLVLITSPHGLWATLGGLATGAVLAGGPQKFGFRAAIFAALAAVAHSSPNPVQSRFGLLSLGVMLSMITVFPFGRKQFSRNKRFYELLTKTLNARGYFKRCELRGALDTIKPGKVLYAAYPHGVLTAGWTWNMYFNSEFHSRAGKVGFLLDEGLRLKSPTFRILCDWCESDSAWSGAATRKVMLDNMAKGTTSLALLPGGFQEATLCSKGKDRVYIKNRAGFVKYCLMHGYAITPVYTFGESDTYATFPYLLKARLALAKRNIPAAAMWGRWWCPFLPVSSAELLTYVGEPLKVPKIAEPTKEDVAKYHQLHIDALQKLFDKHKADAGRPTATLEVF